jgi:hypothetical protein
MTVLNYRSGTQKEYFVNAKPARLGLFQNPLVAQTYQNIAEELAKIAVLTLSTASGDQVITIGDAVLTVPFNTGDNATATDIANTVNGSFAVSGGGSAPVGTLVSQRVSAVAAGAVVTITGRFPGDDFSISYSGTGGTLVTNGTGGSQLPSTSSLIEYGRVVGANSSDSFVDRNNLPCRYPNSANTVIWGIAGGSAVLPYTGSDVPAFRRGDSVSVLRSGFVVAALESGAEPVPGGAVYYRHTANGALNQLGKLAAGSGTGLTALTGARFESKYFLSDGIRCAWVNLRLA